MPGKFHQTDAVFNVAYALGSLQQRNSGIYICMNGQTFAAGHVKKNRDAGIFEGEAVNALSDA